MAFTYTNIADREVASSVRAKINALGSNAANLSTQTDTNTGNISTLNTEVGDNTSNITTNAQNIATLTTNTTNAILQFTNKTVAVSGWTVDTSTYTYYQHRADITCTGVTTDHMAFVALSPHNQESGNFIGAKTSANIVSIYCASVPSSTLTIPLIMAIKVVQ